MRYHHRVSITRLLEALLRGEADILAVLDHVEEVLRREVDAQPPDQGTQRPRPAPG